MQTHANANLMIDLKKYMLCQFTSTEIKKEKVELFPAYLRDLKLND